MAALRETMKGLLAGTVVSHNRDDLRPGLQMAAQMTPDSHDRFLARNRAVAPSYGVAPCVPRSFGQCGWPDVSFSVIVSFGTDGASRRRARKRHAVE